MQKPIPNIPAYKMGDQFKNGRTGNTNTIIHIEQDHYYRGSRSYGPFYTLQIGDTKETIQATPAMLFNLFTKL